MSVHVHCDNRFAVDTSSDDKIEDAHIVDSGVRVKNAKTVEVSYMECFWFV